MIRLKFIKKKGGGTVKISVIEYLSRKENIHYKVNVIKGSFLWSKKQNIRQRKVQSYFKP
jgi:hypothetical protein